MRVNRSTCEHYNWGDGCEGWILLPGEGLMIIEERMPPDTREVRHFHSKSRQFFYVLSGQLQIELEGANYLISTAEGIEVPPLARHQVMNVSDRDARFLVCSSPTTRGDRTDCNGENT